MTESINKYEAAESVEIARAKDMILGEKPLSMPDTIVGDPDTLHRPEAFAQCEE
jgi:hypothetical protein